MRRLALTTIFLASAIWSIPLNAKTIYVSKAGSNTSPYDTWAKAATHINTVEASTAAGDTILIGRGVYLGSQIEPPTGSTRPNMTYYLDSAYVANGASDYSGLAQINGADTIPKSTWAVYSGNVYRASWTGTNCDAEQGDEGMTYFATQDGAILTPQTSVANVNAAGEMYHDLAAGYVYVQCIGNVNPNTVEIQVACRSPLIFRDTDQDNIFFGGLDIRNGKRAAVLFLAGSDSCVWRHCQITRASYCQTCNPAVIMSNTHDYDAVAYDSSGNWDATYNRFNEFVACSIGVATSVDGSIGQHGGSGMIFYDATDTYVDSCVFYDLPGDGIEIKNSTWEISIGDGVCSRITVARSFFDTQWSAGVFLYTNAAQCSLYGNIFYKSQDAGVCIGNSTSSTRKDFGLHFIANNTFYQNNCALQVQNSANTANTYADFTGEFKYNVIYDRVASTDAILADNSEHYDFRDPISNLDIDIDSNQIHEPSGTFSAFWGDRTLRNWSYWQGTALNDEYGDTTSPGLNTTTFATTTAKTMSKTYGGQTWTVWGAIQPEDEPEECPDTLVAPVFESPANGATGQQNSVILGWSDSTQVGTVIAYDLQVDNNSDYSSITFSSSTAWSRDTVTTALTYWTTYYWRVRGRTACDTSAWSDSRTFTMADSCILITGKVVLPTADTCYCVRDSLLYTFAQRDTLIHTSGRDNIRIYGSHSGGGRGIIGYSASDTGSNAWVTDSAKGSMVLHVSGSDNVLIKNLTIAPRVIDDSVRGIVAVNVLTVVGITLDNDSILAGGFSSRAYQQSTTGGNRSFNQLLQNSYFGTESKGYHRRDQLYGATIRLATSILQSDRYGGTYQYAYKIRNCRVNTIHTGIGSAGFTLDTTPTPDDTVYPLIFIDTTIVTVDARNDLFMTYDDNDVNNSAGDPFGIAVDGVDRGSRIQGNTISSMDATYYGGDGLLLQHIDATIDSPFVVAYNRYYLQHGAHPRIAEGRQAVVGTYIRNYSSGYYVSGLWYHHNLGYLVVDSHDSSTYRGKLYEGVRMGYDNGSRNNIIENNHFSVVASDSATRTTLDSLQGCGLSFVQRDSLYTGREYTGRGTIARYNYWRVPKTPFWFGETRIGYGANNCKILGDTVNTIYNGDSTFVRFHQSGTYFDHHWQNTITNVVLQGYANYADVVKGTLSDTTQLAYPTENKRRQGKQLELVQTVNLLITDDEATPVADATVWAVNEYGNRIDFTNSNGSGLTNDGLRWRFFGYDALADGFTVEDSTAYNDYTIWAKSGNDSGSVTLTLGAGLGLTDTIALVAGTPAEASPMKILRGINLKGTVIAPKE